MEDHQSGRRVWRVPGGDVDGWAEVPLWVMQNNALAVAKGAWLLPDGRLAKPGQLICLDEDVLSVR